VETKVGKGKTEAKAVAPSVSKAQRQAMAIAKNAPDKLLPRNKGMLKMSKNQLSDFASTSEEGLPKKKRKKAALMGAAPKAESLNSFMQRRGVAK
jgi:hypothetical protein